jgi:hypothetical protein
MYKSTLIKQLKTYSLKEIRELGEYIQSPYFNKNQSVIKLYDYIRKEYPLFEEKNMEKEIVFGKIFPNADYNDGFMRTIIFKLTGLADDYLSHKQFKQNHYVEKWFLLHELNDRMLDKQLEKKIKETLMEFSKVEIHETDYYLYKFLIEYEHFYFMNRLNQDKIEKFINNREIENMFNHLTYYYLLRAFKHFDYYNNAKEIYNISFKTEIFEDILKNLKPESYEDIPVISLYYNISMLHLKKDDTTYFYKVKKQIAEIEKKINKYEIANTYINLENYCKKRIRSGDDSFLNELFDILKIEIDKELYSVHGYMSAKFYRCAVDTALKLKEYEWTLEFTKNYKNKLPPKDIENTYNYSLAHYEFVLGNFNKSLELLSTVKYDEVYQKTDLRCLMAQIYYEMGLEDNLFSHIDSFRHFLMNDRLLPQDRKISLENFIKFLKSIASHKDCFGKFEIDKLRKSIRDEVLVSNKEWLLKKLSEIKAI